MENVPKKLIDIPPLGKTREGDVTGHGRDTPLLLTTDQQLSEGIAVRGARPSSIPAGRICTMIVKESCLLGV